MALDREAEIVRRHPAAIVDDADEPPATRFDCDIDAGGASVERIFDKLLDDGGRPFDALARRDAIDKNRIETADRHGRVHQRSLSEFHTQIASGWIKAGGEFRKNHLARPGVAGVRRRESRVGT